MGDQLLPLPLTDSQRSLADAMDGHGLPVTVALAEGNTARFNPGGGGVRRFAATALDAAADFLAGGSAAMLRLKGSISCIFPRGRDRRCSGGQLRLFPSWPFNRG
jgi:hypothetical protein